MQAEISVCSIATRQNEHTWLVYYKFNFIVYLVYFSGVYICNQNITGVYTSYVTEVKESFPNSRERNRSVVLDLRDKVLGDSITLKLVGKFNESSILRTKLVCLVVSTQQQFMNLILPANEGHKSDLQAARRIRYTVKQYPLRASVVVIVTRTS